MDPYFSLFCSSLWHDSLRYIHMIEGLLVWLFFTLLNWIIIDWGFFFLICRLGQPTETMGFHNWLHPMIWTMTWEWCRVVHVMSECLIPNKFKSENILVFLFNPLRGKRGITMKLEKTHPGRPGPAGVDRSHGISGWPFCRGQNESAISMSCHDVSHYYYSSLLCLALAKGLIRVHYSWILSCSYDI